MGATVTRIGVEVIPERARRPKPPPIDTVEVDRPATAELLPATIPPTPIAVQRDDAMIAVFEAVSRILAARVLLLLGLIGAFVLALMAMQSQTPMSLGVLVAYAVLVLAPLVWLDVKGKRS